MKSSPYPTGARVLRRQLALGECSKSRRGRQARLARTKRPASRRPEKRYSQITHTSSLILKSQISTPARLIFVTHRDDIPSIPCSTEGANRWRLLAEQGRRLRVRSRQPSLRGSRETLPGPTTWVRPATGWWGRMKAGESPLNQGRTVWAPLSAHRRRSRGLRKNAAVERREANALRHWACAARR